ncbi:AraC family transcriptional regulator [Bradyrhizobium sacchari]|uniref:AraC family transcriptional regulator n=2 Tax=Bradyrhizobium sacchari TaxID=1399419 RepID=A0A560J9Z4_9BRAD|nr:AraC family transcriptional regulator [Bradyrhizobium sacchari]TWB48378.1 AraC family transcriptional regulator [Bradyrhizobium sacchari]TWB67755.1 AraC family transcriptional regulator [Bradyrhizobium sacchari]
MPKVEFSSDQLPSHLNDKARFRLWHDIWMEQLGKADMKHAEDKPFHTSSKNVLLGELSVGRFATTTGHYVRTRKHVANDRDDILVGFYRSPQPQLWTAGNQGLDLKPGSVVAFNIAQPVSSFTNGLTAWNLASIPRAQILKLVPHADARSAMLLDPANPAVRHLERTINFLLEADEVCEDPALTRHAQTMLRDLIVLALGARGEVAEIAAERGLRAARQRELIAIIEKRFAEPSLSITTIADALNLSRRYVSDLLLESGATFSERVLELRLQKARAMLSDVRHDGTKVSDIAFACGFNEVTYFNRRFRNLFGCSPTQYRMGTNDRS